MAKIKGILCQLITSHAADAETNGEVYLGLGGREFHLDSKENDFEAGSYREYILGAPPIPSGSPGLSQVHVLDKEMNDPRIGFPLDTNNLSRSPVYIRFEPQFPPPTSDHWNVHYAVVLVYETTFIIGYTPPGGFDNLWLGYRSGKILYLTDEHTTGGDVKLLTAVQKLAAQMKK